MPISFKLDQEQLAREQVSKLNKSSEGADEKSAQESALENADLIDGELRIVGLGNFVVIEAGNVEDRHNGRVIKIMDATSDFLQKLNTGTPRRKREQRLSPRAQELRGIKFRDSNTFRGGVMESPYFVLKRTKPSYGIEWAQSEILAAKFAALTGILAPNNFIVVNSKENSQPQTIESLKKQALEEQEKSVQIASQKLEGYYDLSSFLMEIVNKYPENLLGEYEKNIAQYQELRSSILQINDKTADKKQHKANLYLQIYRLLPAELKDQINELRVVSAWIGNWDMFNWDLDNCGFCVRLNEHGYVFVEPAMVDFGNSLFSGFGGKYKHLSGADVNEPAKKVAGSPLDFDPEIKDSHQVVEEMAGFNESGAVDLLMGRFPRRAPFAEIFDEENNELIKYLSDNNQCDIKKISEGTLRGLYRVASVSNLAIESVVKKWYIFECKELFNTIESNASDSKNLREKLNPKYLIELMKARRDDVVDKFMPLIRRYELLYGEGAKLAKYEAEAAAIDAGSPKPKQFILAKDELTKLDKKRRAPCATPDPAPSSPDSYSEVSSLPSSPSALSEPGSSPSSTSASSISRFCAGGSPHI